MMTLDLGIAAFSERDADGFVGIAFDSYAPGAGQDGVGSVEAHHPLGFLARPRDPDQDQEGAPHLGATVLRLREGNADHVIALGDPRATPTLPTVGKGGSCQYADTGATVLPFCFFDVDKGGGWQCYVPYSGSPPSKAMTIAIDVGTSGQESIQLVHGLGMALTMTAGGKNSIIVKNKAGDAYIEVNDDGVVVNGNTQMVGGLAVGIPTPANPGPAPEAVARAPELVSFATQVTVVLGQIAAALNTLGVPIAGPIPTLAGTVTATKLSTT